MSLFKIHARDIYQGQMPLEALSRTCGPDVIYYTHFNLKKFLPLHPTCNSQRSEYNSYRAGRRRITIMSTTEKDIDTKLNRQDFLLKLTTQLQNHFRTKSWDVKKKHFWEDCGSVCCMYVSMADVIFGIDNYAISSLIVIVCKLLAVQIGLQSNEQFEHDYKTESSFRKMLPANLWFNQTQGWKKDTKIISVKYKEKWIEQWPIISSSACIPFINENIPE